MSLLDWLLLVCLALLDRPWLIALAIVLIVAALPALVILTRKRG